MPPQAPEQPQPAADSRQHVDPASPMDVSPQLPHTQPAAPSPMPGGSAASMLHAAQSMASMASSGSEGIATVSYAIQTQAQATAEELQRRGIETVLPGSLGPEMAAAAHTTSSSDQIATLMARRPSNSHEYAAAVSAHTLSALQASQMPPTPGAPSGSAYPTSGGGGLPAATASSSSPFVPPPSLNLDDSPAPPADTPEAAQAEVGQIAALAAAQEGEAQLRVQALLRAGGGPVPAGSAATGAHASPSVGPTIAARRASSSAAAGNPSGSGSATASPAPGAAAASKVDSSSGSSSPSYLARLGLSHIRLPSTGFEQAWGRTRSLLNPGGRARREAALAKAEDEANESATTTRFWDSGDPAMGFNLGGVPSMPLMPTPPLQMLPPPSSPFSSSRPGRIPPRYNGGPWPNFATGGPRTPQTAGSPADMAALPYPFQVVQTPGGTARAGWWVPPSEVSTERKRNATKLSEGARMINEASSDGRAGAEAAATPPREGQQQVAKGGAHARERTLEEDLDELPYFQPTYRVLEADEYAALATAAAYATAALTTTTSKSDSGAADVPAEMSDPSGGSSPSRRAAQRWRPLQPQQQEAIATQLMAWAGLAGPEAQEEARLALEQRQAVIVSQAASAAGGSAEPSPGPAPAAGSSAAEVDEVKDASSFFPPDFASHYRAQLRALAQGYYSRLHADGLQSPQYAPGENDAQGRAGAAVSGAAAIAPRSSQSSNARHAREDELERTPSKRGKTSSERLASTARAHARTEASDTAPSQAQPQPQTTAATVADGIAAGQDPLYLISAASSAAGLDVRSPQVLEQLLQYAHTLYSTGSKTVPADEDSTQKAQTADETSKGHQAAGAKPVASTKTILHPTLLPLLHTLHKLHPQHLPTLLLLSCAYFTAGDLAASLWYNNEILRIEPNYVESMSNIGTTLRALGRWREAESWWWRAIRLRPGYWDAYENLLGVLCSPQQVPMSDADRHRAEQSASSGQLPQHDMNPVAPRAEVTGPRFGEALELCEYVESKVAPRPQPLDGAGTTIEQPQALPAHLSVSQAPRLQNLFYAKGNLKFVLPGQGVVPAAAEYQRAVEVVISSSEPAAYGVRDLVVATCAAGLLSLGVTAPGTGAAMAAAEVAASLGLDVSQPQQAAFITAGSFSQLCPGGILALVRSSGEAIVGTLLRLGNGQLPMLMLPPESAVRLVHILFADTGGSLPAIATHAMQKGTLGAAQSQQALQQAAQTTSTILLTLAKLYQDAIGVPTPGPHGALTLGGIPPSVSLLLPLYYLSLSLHASASTANNLGILLSSIPITAHVLSAAGQWQQLNGQGLAMQYYTFGLQHDAKHPHLFTNLGSLLKDLGHLAEAVSMYEKAVECNPDFDVALANLGNAIKDQGRTQDSVVYYRRAVQLNPKFPEALCGLVNALLAICDWREVYVEGMQDGDGKAEGPGDSHWRGWMSNVSELLDRQLADGAQYGAGSLQASAPLEAWVKVLCVANGDARPETQVRIAKQLQPFFSPSLDRSAQSINEGSFIIRLVERAARKTQRRWYLKAFRSGGGEASPSRIVPTAADGQRYSRIRLPASLITPSVPTVLPFHTFTLKIPARAIRLISHRNALRISQSTLTQMWLPAHVYPPPPPPSPKLRVGYVSSDFNNHPLSHLMQSVFGFHDSSRFDVFLYATTPSDQSPYRLKIEAEAQHFVDVSAWSNQQVVEQILSDGIHILMNLNGYTKGARNEIFAARPCPVQMEYMGFAGGMASAWTDWIVADRICCPPEMTSVDRWRSQRRNGILDTRITDLGADMDPEGPSNDWVYTERFIYMPHSYFVTDHKQGFREPEERPAANGEMVKPRQLTDDEAWAEEEQRRWKARKNLFPNLPDDFVIFTCFNQLYKLEPDLFKTWLRILARVPNSIIWLLRFPAAGEAHLLRAAREWAGDEVASRLILTEVAPKGVHIHRGRIADLFLDAFECGAHTTSADILWSGTPVLTWPKHSHKMCSCVAASIVHATGHGDQMTVSSEDAYVERAVALAKGIRYAYVDEAGNEVEPVAAQGTITAEALTINTASSSAVPHGSAPTGAQSSAPGASAPAPANVAKQAAVNETAQQELAAATPPRSKIVLDVGPQAPPDASSRRASGELAELRKALFLERESSKLFDTRGWVRDLEAGYLEAWRRFEAGTDYEDTPEWEALPEDAPEKLSGHIFVPPS